MLEQLLDFDPQNQQSLEQWALAHSADHQAIHDAVQLVTGNNMIVWGIYPFDLQHWDQWALKHQQTHNEMNALSGLAGNDLMQVDFKDFSQRETWHFNHFKEHQQIHALYLI